MNAIAFRSIDGPRLIPPKEATDCAVFLWDTSLFPTNDSGLNPGISRRQGFIAQKVEIERNVNNCDDTKDEQNSDRGISWEYWDLSQKVPCRDLIVQPFLKDRKTEIQVTLSACYLPTIAGVTMTPTPDNKSGATGKLSGQPRGFNWTLERRLNFELDCCRANPPCSFTLFISASNSFNTYNEMWEQEGTGIPETLPQRTKMVDGRQAE